jgi:pyruvate/2-oxoglutarate dehydrogenase complex dihydrolipoamide dehydrogenase (E3) component
MSQALRRLGCAVTVLQKADQLAEREDPEAAKFAGTPMCAASNPEPKPQSPDLVI